MRLTHPSQLGPIGHAGRSTAAALISATLVTSAVAAQPISSGRTNPDRVAAVGWTTQAFWFRVRGEFAAHATSEPLYGLHLRVGRTLFTAGYSSRGSDSFFDQAIDFLVHGAQLFVCFATVAAAATQPALVGALLGCSGTLLSVLATGLDDEEGERIINNVIEASVCGNVGLPWGWPTALSCVSLFWNNVRARAQPHCSYVGGKWQGTELVVIDGQVQIGGMTTDIYEIVNQEGSIEIQQEGCDIEWLVGGLLVRRGDVGGNNITVTGDAALIVSQGAVVTEHINRFTASGKVCNDFIDFDGTGRYSADIDTPNGPGRIDIDVTSTVIVRYQSRGLFTNTPRQAEVNIAPGLRLLIPSDYESGGAVRVRR